MKRSTFKICTLSDYKRLTFKDFLCNKKVDFQNRVKIVSGRGPRRLPHLPHSKSAPGFVGCLLLLKFYYQPLQCGFSTISSSSKMPRKLKDGTCLISIPLNTTLATLATLAKAKRRIYSKMFQRYSDSDRCRLYK